MKTELDVIIEHWERYRAVTLQFLDLVAQQQLGWRPDEHSFTYGQHLQHIAQTEDYYHAGLFESRWDAEIMRGSERASDPALLRAYFEQVRTKMRDAFALLSDQELARPMKVPHAPGEFPLRWWLWFILEHEIHHKAQLAIYARAMGHVPPYYALPLPPGTRPDIVMQ